MTDIVTDRNSPQKHVWRAQIVLLSADGCGTVEVTRRAGTSKTSVWRWQDRFQAEGVAGLLHDKTRRSRIPPLSTQLRARVVAATQATRPGQITHWTSGDGQIHWGQCQFGAANMARAWIATAQDAFVQAF